MWSVPRGYFRPLLSVPRGKDGVDDGTDAVHSARHIEDNAPLIGRLAHRIMSKQGDTIVKHNVYACVCMRVGFCMAAMQESTGATAVFYIHTYIL